MEPAEEERGGRSGRHSFDLAAVVERVQRRRLIGHRVNEGVPSKSLASNSSASSAAAAVAAAISSDVRGPSPAAASAAATGLANTASIAVTSYGKRGASSLIGVDPVVS